MSFQSVCEEVSFGELTGLFILFNEASFCDGTVLLFRFPLKIYALAAIIIDAVTIKPTANALF
jgi:hypothetical protein